MIKNGKIIKIGEAWNHSRSPRNERGTSENWKQVTEVKRFGKYTEIETTQPE